MISFTILYNYIVEDSRSIDVALNYLDMIEKAIMCLEDFPYKGSIPRYSILKKQGYRVIIIKRHLVFHKVNEAKKLVTIYVVVDGRKEYKNSI